MITGWEARAKAAGVSIAKVCEKAGVHSPSFSKWKARKNGITLGSIEKMERALASFETSHPALCTVCDHRLDDGRVRSCPERDCPHAQREAA